MARIRGDVPLCPIVAIDVPCGTGHFDSLFDHWWCDFARISGVMSHRVSFWLHFLRNALCLAVARGQTSTESGIADAELEVGDVERAGVTQIYTEFPTFLRSGGWGVGGDVRKCPLLSAFARESSGWAFGMIGDKDK